MWLSPLLEALWHCVPIFRYPVCTCNCTLCYQFYSQTIPKDVFLSMYGFNLKELQFLSCSHLYTPHTSINQEADDRHSLELESLVEQVRVCESVLSDERRQHAFTQGEVTRLNQELEDCKDSLLREKSTTTELLKVSVQSVWWPISICACILSVLYVCTCTCMYTTLETCTCMYTALEACTCSLNWGYLVGKLSCLL